MCLHREIVLEMNMVNPNPGSGPRLNTSFALIGVKSPMMTQLSMPGLIQACLVMSVDHLSEILNTLILC